MMNLHQITKMALIVVFVALLLAVIQMVPQDGRRSSKRTDPRPRPACGQKRRPVQAATSGQPKTLP